MWLRLTSKILQALENRRLKIEERLMDEQKRDKKVMKGQRKEGTIRQ